MGERRRGRNFGEENPNLTKKLGCGRILRFRKLYPPLDLCLGWAAASSGGEGDRSRQQGPEDRQDGGHHGPCSGLFTSQALIIQPTNMI